ncbi:hypothetical protein GWI33_015612 [Rhynchophorus ferrugineus]|uniref:Uncharacterized protein n=1 Tax=Rhynchophorus ferrugineus TaxID=354439 RepID=A0A834I2N0_RHYFE|nr:hypothetical protein GWI33_015612 [Rhynchophorus ferrugineus]
MISETTGSAAPWCNESSGRLATGVGGAKGFPDALTHRPIANVPTASERPRTRWWLYGPLRHLLAMVCAAGTRLVQSVLIRTVS